MKDPIGSFDTIKDNFIRYVKTAFSTKFESVEAEREALLNTDRVLNREPWIEPLPDYLSSDLKIKGLSSSDLPDMDDTAIRTFKGIVSQGLMPDTVELHWHQKEMLTTSLSRKNCVITSGTGSGKTESFLLPLFAQLSKELSQWKAPNTKHPNCDNWWKTQTPRDIVDKQTHYLSLQSAQRSCDNRPAAVRALILYPMNALVEDQMTRLRKALDSDDARSWLKQNANGNYIYFGRYNGTSPISGELITRKDGKEVINTNKVLELKKKLRIIENASEKVSRYIFQNPNLSSDKKKDLKAFFQRLDGAEMRCRFDMQMSPPDILITNYSMLSIMLMRKVDSPILEKTREWLQCKDEYSRSLSEEQKNEERKKRIFHLVIDELHLYRGTQGTEIAYLLRLVLKRLGLHPEHPQLRILASSASLESEGEFAEKSKTFLKDFFGVINDSFTIIPGKTNPVEKLKPETPLLPVEPFILISEAYEKSNRNLHSELFKKACSDSADSLHNKFRLDSSNSNGIEKLLETINDPKLFLRERLYSACEIDGKYKAVCSLKSDTDKNEEQLPYFSEKVFGFVEKNKLKSAVRGLLISRALFDEFKHIEDKFKKRKLPRFRFHFFFRNIEGVWAAVKPDMNHRFYDTQRPVGELFSSSKIKSKEGYRILEALYCDNCGTMFLGGSRCKSKDNVYVEMLPVSPNIEGIPEKTSAKLVEKRNYQEYAIFWPQRNQVFKGHVTSRGNPSNHWKNQTQLLPSGSEFFSSWVEASINIYSGDVELTDNQAKIDPEKWLKGRIFVIRHQRANGTDVSDTNWLISQNLQTTHQALPCICPGCAVDYSSKLRTSPLRSFRTGFTKTNQILAKELMYQLPDTPEQRKLVMFSDSREDAAQIANGIERNHYEEVFREILVNELQLSYNIFKAIVDNNISQQTYYKENYREDFDEMHKLYEETQIPNPTNNQTLKAIIDNATQRVEKLKSLIIPVRELMENLNPADKLCAPIIRRFLKLGINPGGNDIKLQSLSDGTKWHNIFDFRSYEWLAGTSNFFEDIKAGAYSKLSVLFFARLFYSLESAGLGQLIPNLRDFPIGTYSHPLGISEARFSNILASVIRILGDKNRHGFSRFRYNPATQYSEFVAQVRRYIEGVSSKIGCSNLELGEAVYNALRHSLAIDDSGILILRNLVIKASTNSDQAWLCNNCSRPHLHNSEGVCTFCLGSIPENANSVCRELWGKNYLSFHASIEKRKSIRLHCEELTGQTDDQFERQRHFRNVILEDEGAPQARAIDLLSVTTTLEVGVDIGSLQAVMLANMPPQRFNYQQRVGRSGRRGQAYSLILTFCRGRSHDEYFFSNPHRITGDPPPVPFLTIGQDRIFYRLFAKEILRLGFRQISSSGGVHGEFGHISLWATFKPTLINWISQSHDEIKAIIRSLKPDVTHDKLAQYFDWAVDINGTGKLVNRIDSILANTEIAGQDIAEKLAEGGLLPMFGMPTVVRNMYHGIEKNSDGVFDLLSINRPQSMAIYDFAPGSQKTKDKAIYTAIGFTTDLQERRTIQGGLKIVSNDPDETPFSLSRWMIRCKKCGYNRTSAIQPSDICCPNAKCKNDEVETFKKFLIKSPIAYRTDFMEGRDSKEDSDIMLSRPPILAEQDDESNVDVPKQPIANCSLSISDRDITWRINTNSDLLFTGAEYNATNQFPTTGSLYFPFTKQWILNGFEAGQEERGYKTRFYNKGTEESIALAANKKTEILRISPKGFSESVDLNMFDFSCSSAFGVKAGFYSAAFILQRVLADRLDVDPNEIEIADIRQIALQDGTDRITAEIILTDELANGSGFVRNLYNDFDQILADCLKPTKIGSYTHKIHSPNHSDCEGACYDCLKVFRNMSFHSLLDWRLGLSALRILADVNYQAGSDGKFSDFIELNSWPKTARDLRNEFGLSFNLDPCPDFHEIPGLFYGKKKNNVILIVHPFWKLTTDNKNPWLSKGIKAAQDFVAKNGGELKFIDTFNLLRRPGWCYEKIFQ